jgi:hypothetical protein
VLGCRLDIGERVRPLQLLHVRDPLLDLGVRQREAWLDAIEHRGRDRHEAFGGVLIGDAFDVIGEPEDLLHHDEPADRRAVRLRDVRVELVPVFRFQLDHLSHRSLLRALVAACWPIRFRTSLRMS